MENHDAHREGAERAASSSPPPRASPTSSASPATASGMADEEGLKNCAEGARSRSSASRRRRRSRSAWSCSTARSTTRTTCATTPPWGVELCKAVGSPRFKLLYDIYHMQIMEGDVIRTIRDNNDYIAHYHTGGVPGPQRDRRDAGAELPGDHQGDRGDGLQGLSGAGVHPEARPAHVAGAGVRDLRRVRCEAGDGSVPDFSAAYFFLGWQTWVETAFFKLAEVAGGVTAEASLLAAALPALVQVRTQPPPILHITRRQFQPFLRTQPRRQARHHAAPSPSPPSPATPACRPLARRSW